MCRESDAFNQVRIIKVYTSLALVCATEHGIVLQRRLITSFIEDYWLLEWGKRERNREGEIETESQRERERETDRDREREREGVRKKKKVGIQRQTE